VNKRGDLEEGFDGLTEQRWKFSVTAEMAQIRGIFGETKRELEAHEGQK